MDVDGLSVDIASIDESLYGIDLWCMFGFLNSMLDGSVDISSLDVSLDVIYILCVFGFLKFLNSVLLGSVKGASVDVFVDEVDVWCTFVSLRSVLVDDSILILSLFRSHFQLCGFCVVYVLVHFWSSMLFLMMWLGGRLWF